MNACERVRLGIAASRTDQERIAAASFRGGVRRLALCLSAALAPATALPAWAASPISVHTADIQRTPARPNGPLTWTVTNCSDGDTNSLREIIDNPNTLSGDTVDLSQVPMFCGDVDSVITLLNGEISIDQNDLTLTGPAPVDGTVTVSGGGASQVFHHTGTGTLTINALTIADGYRHRANDAAGGCIQSHGNVALDLARVIGCTAWTDSGYAYGGGIYASGSVQLIASTISGNKVVAPAAYGLGGGICSHGLLSKYSSVSHNVAYDGSGGSSVGGGAFSYGNVGIYHSTIDNNTGSNGSALVSNATTHVTNSTISDNAGGYSTVLVSSGNALSLEIANSTVAFNHLNAPPSLAGAVVFNGSQPSDSISLHSSIIAKNTTSPGNTPADVYVRTGHGVLSGADNLVIASNVAPPPGVITVTADPKLSPLQLNGGLLPTRSLLSGSPALGKGNATVSFPPNDTNTHDQRGPGYPRSTDSAGNVTTDIGAVQFDTIFFDDFH
jgi:hypothetical protein